MSDVLIASLQKRIDELGTQVATLNAEGKTRRQKNKQLEADLKAATEQVASLTTERDTFKQKAESGPTEHTAKIAELEGKLLDRDHRDAFAGVKDFAVKVKADDGTETESKYALNDGATIDDVWSVLGYKAEGAAPDAARVTALMAEARGKKGLFFKPAGETPNAEAGASQTAIRTAAARPGPGASRSNPATTQATSALSQIDAAHGSRDAYRIA